MRYCSRCVYPENARPATIFDEQGVCSGCRYHESRSRINWKEREKALKEILSTYKAKAKAAGNPYDCIIPVGGGKDSHYQTYLLKEVYGMNPLLVTYNHAFNTRLGIRNLNNLVARFGCDLIRFTSNPVSVRKISRYMIKKVGDLTWHYHAGIRTFPFQVAVKYEIPLVVWGEHGFAELVGMFTLSDLVEHTKWVRQEHDMRGLEPEDIINEESGITWHDVAPFVYPADEELEEVGVRGIYLSNYIYWDAKRQAELVIEKCGFKIFQGKRDRTFCLFAKTDDHANDVHDYMKYLKFGYGRGTDDASVEIRHGRMTREEGIDMVRQYDPVRPRTLDVYLKFLGVTEKVVEDSVVNHVNSLNVEKVRVPQVEDRTFSKHNSHLYYCGDRGSAVQQPRRWDTNQI